jgi:hypothetical protein
MIVFLIRRRKIEKMLSPAEEGAGMTKFFSARRILRITAMIFLPVCLLAAFGGVATALRAGDAWDEGTICTVDAEMNFPDLCPGTGPASQRAEYWRMGLLPRRPLPALALDPELKHLDRIYAAVSKGRVLETYASIDDAVAGTPLRRIGPGIIICISIIDIFHRDGETYYMTGDYKDFVRAGDVSLLNKVKDQFGGVELVETPTHPFGWVVDPQGIYPSRWPGEEADPTAPYYARYQPVEVFDTRKIGDSTWYMIGINQWVEQKPNWSVDLRNLALVFPAVGRPEGIPAGVKWIYIDLFQQTLYAFEEDRLAFATLAATGGWGFWTRPGTYQTYKKREYDPMSGFFNADKSDYYYLMDVPWVMYFDKARAIHGEYWHNTLGQPGSHGCVNVPVADGRWLYDWAPLNTWVYVIDPSGITPTDEASYANDAPAV